MQIIKLGILVLTLAVIIGSASATDVFVTPSSKTVTQGQTFNLYVSIDPKGTAIAGVQLNLAFNGSVININTITEGDLFKQNGVSTFFNAGVVTNSLGTVVNIFGTTLGSTSVSTPGTFIIISATAVGSSGVSGIELSNAKVSDPGGDMVALNVINGSVTLDTPAQIAQELIISNITAISGKSYVSDTLAIGKLKYIDRSYTFSSVPSSYEDLKYIRTANDDKASTGSVFLEFDVNKDVTVYVAHDDRISPKPSWLSSFIDTGDSIVGESGTFSMYVKNFSAGHISLGGNYGDGYSMYNVVLRPSTPIPAPVTQELIITSITAASGKTYVLDNLTAGKLKYIDRTYTFSSVPSSYEGLKYIRTANDDKTSASDFFLQFDVNQNVTVYVAHDDRISPKPSWLSTFIDIGDDIVAGGEIFSMYAKDFSAGHISLGGNYGDDSSMYNVVLRPSALITIFSDDMESGSGSWAASGLWHIATKRYTSPTKSWWYGDESTGNYNTAKNSGYLVSPEISLANAISPKLSFMSWYQTDQDLDKKIVEISIDGGNTWAGLKQISDTPSQWNLEQIDLSSYAGKTIKIRFNFDTKNALYNSFEGWYIDDVKIEYEKNQ